MLALPAVLFAISLLDWSKGPEQWIMTAEEKRIWRAVKSEDEARDYVDLFWARRDPTPGTPRNEFREEFEARVTYADKNFEEGKRRGALTERGRVLAVLGFPSNLGTEAEKKTGQFVMGGSADRADPTGGRTMAAREVWYWEHKDAVKYGMPKIEVIFFHDGLNGEARRDPQRADFIHALPAAIKYAIKNPDLTSVPDWARAGLQWQEAQTLTPPAVQTLPEPAPEVTQSPLPLAGEGGAQRRVRAAATGKLTLVTDAFALQPQSGKDPFAGLSNQTKFAKDGELGWAVEHCTGKLDDDLPAVNVGLRISGPAEGDRVNFTAPEEEMVPDSIKSSPGCFLVRGSVPLLEMEQGTYELTVTVGKYNLTREFRIE
jgi:GWxTD domain-containing protein